MGLRLCSIIALLPIVLCLSCAAGGGEQAEPVPAPASRTSVREPTFTPAGHDVRSLTISFVEATCEYDATIEGRLNFLTRTKSLVTAAELTRLARSPRAQLPWPAIRARRERVEVRVDDVTQVPSRRSDRRVLVWVTITTRTTFATVRGHDLVTLTVVPRGSGWKVGQARGTGL